MIKDSFDIAFILKNIIKIIGALPVTIELTIVTLFFGWLIGFVLAFGKIKGAKWLQNILRIVTDVIRGIPTVVLLFIVYFGVPILVENTLGLDMGDFPKKVFVIIALTIELAVSSSEMFRSAFNSIKKGQLEAAHALGYTGFQSLVHIIIPQGVYVILPNLCNAVLSVIQATALVYTLGVFDILGKARQIDTNNSGTKTFEMYITVAIIYWTIALLVNKLFATIETYFGRGKGVAV